MDLDTLSPRCAWHRLAAHRRAGDRGATASRPVSAKGSARALLNLTALLFGFAALSQAALAEPLRLATYAGDFSRRGPGLLLRELLSDRPPPALQPVLTAAPDILLLTDFDYDAGLVALDTLRALLSERGLDYPHRFSRRPHTGRASGLDLDGDGRLGEPEDAYAFGWFAGQSGLAVLSKLPLSLRENHDETLWKDLPDSAMLPEDPGFDSQPLARAGLWALDVKDAQDQALMTLLTVSAGPPVFDGPEDRNGRRNRDEVLFWTHQLDDLKALPEPVVLLGNFNLDPKRGDGLRAAMQTVLAAPRLQDPAPGTDTVRWDSTGPMRVSYVLPDRALTVLASGLTPPVPESGPHSLVWVDLSLPERR